MTKLMFIKTSLWFVEDLKTGLKKHTEMAALPQATGDSLSECTNMSQFNIFKPKQLKYKLNKRHEETSLQRKWSR